MISSFRILLGVTAKLGPLASAEIVIGDRLLLDRFLTVLNWKLLCGLRLLYFFICRSVDYIWMFWNYSYAMRSKICQISRNVEEKRRWSLKDFWKILFICALVKLMRSLVRIRLVLWKMFFDFLVRKSCEDLALIDLEIYKAFMMNKWMNVWGLYFWILRWR